MTTRVLLATFTTACLTASAFAADLPRGPALALSPAPIFTWTGFYLGGQVAYQWSTKSSGQLTSVTGVAVNGQPNFNQSGPAGGVHIGYNWQFSQFVLGIEGDVDGAGFSGAGSAGAGSFLSVGTQINMQESVRGRAGFAWDRVLFYGTGGIAFARLENKYFNSVTSFGLDDITTSRTGWTAGGGIEYAFRPDWSFNLEYRYTDLGHTNDLLASSSAGTLRVNRHETFEAVRMGVSYHFITNSPTDAIFAKQ